MAFDYAQARLDAQEIIEEFGQPSNFIIKGSAGGKDNRGNVIPATPDVLIAGTITPKLSFKSMEIDETKILSGDCYVYFHSDTKIETGMLTTLNGVTYRAVDTFPFDSVDNINIYQKIQLRA